jgi:hypothetical protein
LKENSIIKKISNKKKEESISIKWRKTVKEESKKKKHTFCRMRKIWDHKKRKINQGKIGDVMKVMMQMNCKRL